MGSRTATARRRIAVDGPLAPFADGLRRDLAGQGYALDTVGDHVHLLADLSGWLSGRGSDRGGPDERGGRRFLADRRAAGRRVGVSGRGLAPALGYLRRLGVAPPHAAVSPATPLDVLMAEYRRYLEGERGLSAGTVTHYLRCARVFLTWLPEPVGKSLPALSAGQVTDYVLGWTAGRGGGAAVDTVTLPALRSLLRFLHVAGHVRSAAGGSGAGWRRRTGERGRAAGGVE